MFDGLFKPKFYTKCKSLVKITKTRVETVKRKKNSVCKYLKNDIVDLLKNSLDYNAYGRAQGLIEEKRRLSCYELLEQFCICVASNVPLLQKSSKCPDECLEAISSLAYAAARVSEVPELRDLRSLFAERYGNSLEQFVNPEFVDRFKVEPPSKEMKVEMLQEIAREYSIKWDAKSLEQRLYTTHHHTESEQPKQKTNEDKANSPETTWDDDDKKNKPVSRRSENESCDPETKPLYYRFIMHAPSYKNYPKMEKQESHEEKNAKCDLMGDETDSPTAAGRRKPRSVRQRLAKPPPEDMVRSSDSMMNRRTASWQPKASNVPDFDEVAARVDALTRN